MVVKLLSIYAGAKGCYPAGAHIDVSDEEAGELIRGGFAVAVESGTTAGERSTVAAAPETTVLSAAGAGRERPNRTRK
jgi:hypothetical protein